MRRRTDPPTQKEMQLLAENNQLGARIIELERELAARKASAWEDDELIRKLRAENRALLSDNQAKCSELAEMAGEIRELQRDRNDARAVPLGVKDWPPALPGA
jgi:hypothetical protein